MAPLQPHVGSLAQANTPLMVQQAMRPLVPLHLVTESGVRTLPPVWITAVRLTTSPFAIYARTSFVKNVTRILPVKLVHAPQTPVMMAMYVPVTKDSSVR